MGRHCGPAVNGSKGGLLKRPEKKCLHLGVNCAKILWHSTHPATCRRCPNGFAAGMNRVAVTT